MAVKACGIESLRRQQSGMEPDAMRGTAPASCILEVRNDILNSAMVENVAPLGLRRLGGGDNIAPAAVEGALLGDQSATLEPHVSIATNEVDGAVNLRVLKVELALVVVGIVGTW